MIGISIVKTGMCDGCGESDIELTSMESADLTGWHYKEHFLRCKHEDACRRAYDQGLLDGLTSDQKKVKE